jgi:putative Mg2+ transporter-C (MgtC) family protein
MLQVNALLPTAGRASNSFVMNDLMRLPLGILTGVGFIGGGAILRRGDMVVGVTTAATLWLATVIGLCLGGGQIALGLSATCLSLFALWGLKWVENRLRQESDARLLLMVDPSGPGEADIRRRLKEAGLSIFASRVDLSSNGMYRELVLDVRQFRLPERTEVPAAIAELTREAGVIKAQWRERR